MTDFFKKWWPLFFIVGLIFFFMNMSSTPPSELEIQRNYQEVSDTEFIKFVNEGKVAAVFKHPYGEGFEIRFAAEFAAEDEADLTLQSDSGQAPSTNSGQASPSAASSGPSGSPQAGKKYFKFYAFDHDFGNNSPLDKAFNQVQAKKVKPEADVSWGAVLISFLPLILIFFLFLILPSLLRSGNSGGGGPSVSSFLSSRAKLHEEDGASSVTFKDVAGVDEAKFELQEEVEFLKGPERFEKLGAKIPKGVLLIGPPGCGKTLLARAVAGEAGVPFFSISGSEFVEMFVGVGASRVRDLFLQAKKSAPCIIFIDEIDAVGRHRGAGIGGSHDEREQTLNQILVEMDGFDKHTKIIVMAATNRPDILDPALIRPGRFDRKVIVDTPDVKGREAILAIHARGKSLGPDVSLAVIAKRTPGLSGADLANIVNEAAILAARENAEAISRKHFAEAIERVLAGPERKSKVISLREKEITAYHEAGHAIVGHVLPHVHPVYKISIIRRGRMGGFTQFLPEEDQSFYSFNELQEMLAASLGGRVGEEAKYGQGGVTTGASNDLEKVRSIAWNMVMRYGMAFDLVPQSYGETQEMVFLGKQISQERDYSEARAAELDDARDKIVKNAFVLAKAVMEKHRELLDRLARQLMEKEVLEGEEVAEFFTGIEQFTEEEMKTILRESA